MTEASATVKIHIKKGTKTTKPNSGHKWKQAKELDPGKTKTDWNPDDWNIASKWWYYFTGMNKGGSMNNGVRENGRLQFPGDHLTFTVSGKVANDAVEQIVVTDSSRTDHYTVTQPTSDNNYVASVEESPHNDPEEDDDHFHVWGNGKDGNNPVPTVYCDPIIRNRN